MACVYALTDFDININSLLSASVCVILTESDACSPHYISRAVFPARAQTRNTHSHRTRFIVQHSNNLLSIEQK